MSLDVQTDRGNQLETIVAIATPEGESGLAVVRMSGADSIMVAQQIFQNREFKHTPETHRAYHGFVTWPARGEHEQPPSELDRGLTPGQAVDEVIALPMLAPQSYTGEDSVEFFCHGGRIPARLIMEACLRAGAGPAGPGEFTRRAFLNGKLSLDQAEAVADLIHAENELAAAASLRQLQGGFDQELQTVEAPLRTLLADLEGCLEFAETENVAVSHAHQTKTIETAIQHLQRLLSLAVSGRRLREGVQVVLVGPPNVGKSSLFNALLGESRVLVDHEPGTTRDIVTARIRHEGILFVLHDTAGLWDQGGRVEKMGMELTRQSISRADVILKLHEAFARDNEDIKQSIDIDTSTITLPGSEAVELFVITKIDVLPRNEVNYKHKLIDSAIFTSAHTGEGLQELWRSLLSAANREELRKATAMGVVMNIRHQQKLVYCQEQLSSLYLDMVKNRPGSEVVASWLAGILSNLGEVSGRVFSESVLDSVFARFCIGK